MPRAWWLWLWLELCFRTEDERVVLRSMLKYNQIGTKLYSCISAHVCSHVVICASSKDVCSVKARFHVCHILFPQYSTEQCFELWQNSLMSLGTHTCPQACWLSLRLPSLEAVSPWFYSVTLSNLMMPLSVPTSLLVFVPRLYSLHSFYSFLPMEYLGAFCSQTCAKLAADLGFVWK